MPDKLSVVVYSDGFEEVHYALVMASAAISVNAAVTLFFTMGATRALLRPSPGGAPGWRALRPNAAGLAPVERDEEFKALGVATFEELLDACASLGVRFMVCEMGLRAMRLEPGDLRDDLALEVGGVVTFLADTSRTGKALFI
jgi:peroxiredoxin family protein